MARSTDMTVEASVADEGYGRLLAAFGSALSTAIVLWAINLRCQANKDSGMAILATSAKSFRPRPSPALRPPTSLVVIESHSSASELLTHDPILFTEVIK
jgi:hypothetical protein